MDMLDVLDVEATDVVRVILQFCRENGLESTFAALQEEAQVSLNAVESVNGFVEDIRAGRWEAVLQAATTISIPQPKLAALYEQIVLELVELRDGNSARQLLRNAEPLHWLATEAPDRYKHLELLSAKPYWDPREAYPEGSSRDGRRAAVADLLADEVTEAPPSRLLALIGQALKWQRLNGMLPKGGKLDLLRNAAPARMREEEERPTRTAKEISFGKKSHPEIVKFSPDGLWLVTGSSDGFIEVREPESGKLSKQLNYQAEDALMMHEAAVLCLDFTRDAELLATGCQGITCLAFARDSSQLVSGSFDGTARLHGLRSGKLLREFRGHTSYVNDVLWSSDGGRIVTASSDGTARVWEAKSAECVCTLRPPHPNASGTAALCSLALWPSNAEHIAICSKTAAVHLMSFSGQLIKSFESEGADFVHCAVSPRGEWVYAAGADQKLHCFASFSGKLENSLKVADKDLIGAAHHPFRNIVATWACDGLLRLWVP